MNHPFATTRILFVPGILLLAGCSAGDTPDADSGDAVSALVARGQSLEIPGDWAIPPGDPLHHATAGFAKVLCSKRLPFRARTRLRQRKIPVSSVHPGRCVVR